MENLLQDLAATLTKLSPTPANSRRLFHGRGHIFPGLEFLAIDLFDPILLITLFKAPPLHFESAFLPQLLKQVEATRLQAVVLQRRHLKNAPSEIIYGELPPGTYAQRNDLRFRIKLGQQQNIGYFLDMEPGRQWLEAKSQGKRILNLFAYTCVFSVIAIATGADHVFNVDMSRSALNQGRENHRLNKLPSQKASYYDGNVFKSWGRIQRKGPYDLVIIDPPSYQPGSFVAKNDYAKVIRRLPKLLRQNGCALLSLNAPEITEYEFKNQIQAACPEMQFTKRLRPSSDFPDVHPDHQLKLLVYETPATGENAL
ncbi:MAG: class I SAM-dependent methyltransferase [Verrucomicrobiota bacterium]